MTDPVLSGEAHWTLDKLEEITDLHFVFTKEACGRVSPEKFSEAYQASSYSVTKDPTGISGILGEMEYDRELLKGQHLYYFVMDLKSMKDIDHTQVNKIILASEVLKKSIYKITRLSPEALAETYSVPEVWYKKTDRRGLYTTHKTTDKVLVVRHELYEAITKFLENKHGYQETFRNYQDFFGSVISRMEDRDKLVFNKSIEDVKISANRIQS